MRLFKKQEKAYMQSSIWITQVRERIEQRQQKVANYLGRKTQYWNRSSWLIALVLFILFFGGCCLLLCIKAFIHL